MSSSSAFNPSRIRKDSEPKVEQRGLATFSFSDAYEGRFEFFEQRPIDIGPDENKDGLQPDPPAQTTFVRK